MKIFIYSYLGFLLPIVSHTLPFASRTEQVYFINKILQTTWNMIGAAFAAAAPGIPSWSTGFQEGNNPGGLLAAALAPAGGFGKFLLVLLAVSTSAACTPTLYSFGESKYTVYTRCCLFTDHYPYFLGLFDKLCLF